jgi:hypothetical protein
LIIALVGTALLAAGCGDARPYWRQALLWVDPPPLAPPALSATVEVAPLTGLPARWRLDERVAAALREREVLAHASDEGISGYKLSGRAETAARAPTGAAPAELAIRWQLVDSTGAKIGEVVQLAAVSAAAWRGSADATLDAVAAAAAESLTPILPAEVASAAEQRAAPPRPAPRRAKAQAEGASLADLRPAARPQLVSAKVSARPPRPATRSRARKTAPKLQLAAATKQYFVQLGAFRSRRTSTRTWRVLRARHPGLLGSTTHFVSQRDYGPSKGIYFLVRIGPYPGRPAAEAKCAELKAADVDCFVVRAAIAAVAVPAAGVDKLGAAPPLAAKPPAAKLIRKPPSPKSKPKKAEMIRSTLGGGPGSE